MRPLMTLLVGIALLAAPGMRAQTVPSKPTDKPAGSKPAGKPTSAVSAKPAKEAAAKSPAPVAIPVSVKKPVPSEPKIARRDPFESLIGRKQAQDALSKNLPPGKAGLQIGTLRLDGIVKSANGMIAVVANPQQRTYFLREGDQLYDGKVEKISMESVTFHEEGKDAFGKLVERQVNKRLYSSAGEQQ